MSMIEELSHTYARPTPVRWQMVSESGRASFSPVHRVDGEGRTRCGLEIPIKAFRPGQAELEKHPCIDCWRGVLA